MKKMIAVFALFLMCASGVQAKPYFNTIFKDPTHPKMSASALYTAALAFDGAVTDVAIVYHKADKEDSLWPQKLIDLGMPPISWTLLELGLGGNRKSAFVRGGLSVDIAPTLLGPLTSALERVGGAAAAFGKLIIDPNGSGVKLSLGWKAHIIGEGEVRRLNDISFPPRYGVGYTYQF